MKTWIHRTLLTGVATAALGTAIAGAASGGGSATSPSQATTTGKTPGKVVRLKDARLKFEVNATDSDGGVQLFLDADPWKQISLFDPSGAEILTTTTTGRMGRQGGTELFLESAEPTFSQLSLTKLLRRFPKGKYAVRGTGLKGERYIGTAILGHDIPAGPQLVSPLTSQGPQKPTDMTVTWKPVAPPNGSPIIGYQVLIVQPNTGLRTLPKVTLDVTMPPTATSLKVPPGFLLPNTEYEWEVLAIEKGGNQTLSSETFTTGP